MQNPLNCIIYWVFFFLYLPKICKYAQLLGELFFITCRSIKKDAIFACLYLEKNIDILDGSCSSTYSTTFYKGYFDKWHKIKVQVFKAKRQEEEIRAIVLEMGGYLSTYSRTRPYQLVSIIDYKFNFNCII
jgi:endo-1,4-beta-mannosidase